MVHIQIPPAGQRLSVRWRDDNGDVHDVVGQLVRLDEDSLVLLPEGRPELFVPRGAVIATRVAPPRAVRPSSSADDLQRLVARGWPGLEVVRMGGWSLNVGAGFCSRANSVHPTGDPGRPLATAIDRCVAFYTERGLTPCFQLAARDFGSDEPAAQLDRELSERGWRPTTPSTVMVLDLTNLPGLALDPSAEVVVGTTPDEEWLAVKPLKHPRALEVLSSAPAQYVRAEVDGRPVARLRVVPTLDWVGLTCLEVVPDQVFEAVAGGLCHEALLRARGQGARWAWLQVGVDDAAARAMFGSLGFTDHHQCRYRVLDEACTR